MKFVIGRQELTQLVNKCMNVISAKATIPILSNILIEAANGTVTLTSTDLTVGVRCSAEAKIIQEGGTTISSKRFAPLLRELTAMNVEISTGSNEITEIVADDSRFRLLGMDKREFPGLPDLEGALRFKVNQAELKDALYRTSFAVSREDNRYVLTGIYLHIANGQATFAGTDGKRLARTFISIDLDPTFQGTFIIPLKAIDEVLKNLREDGQATAYLMNDKIAFETDDTMIITKLLSGIYPDINLVIPNSVENLVPLHREELITLLRQVSLFNESNHTARFVFADGELRLAANSSEIGEGRVSMPANYHGAKFEIAFNPIYFLDFLRHSKAETVTLGLTDSFNPGVITDQEIAHYTPSQASPLFVLMPMRLNE